MLVKNKVSNSITLEESNPLTVKQPAKDPDTTHPPAVNPRQMLKIPAVIPNPLTLHPLRIPHKPINSNPFPPKLKLRTQIQIIKALV
jgi:hypothetical protein